MDNRRIIYDLLDQTREPIINFWGKRVGQLNTQQLNILRDYFRWGEGVSKEFDNLEVSLQDFYLLIKTFATSWNELIGGSGLDPMVRTLAYQLKTYRNGIAHYDPTHFASQVDFIHALLAIRKFHQLLECTEIIGDIDKYLVQATINYLRDVIPDEELVSVFAGDLANALLLASQVSDEIHFHHEYFISHFADNKVWQIDIKDGLWEIDFFFEVVKTQFTFTKIGIAAKNFSWSDYQKETADIVKDFSELVRLIYKRDHPEIEVTFPPIIPQSDWEALSDEELSHDEEKFFRDYGAVFAFFGLLEKLGDSSFYYSGNNLLEYTSFIFWLLNENILSGNKVNYKNLFDYLQTCFTIRDFLYLQESEYLPEFDEFNDLSEQIGLNSVSLAPETDKREQKGLTIRPGKFPTTTYVSNGKTWICFGPKKFDVARDHYDDLKSFVEKGLLREYQEGEYQGHPVIVLPDVSDPVLMFGKNKAELLLQYFDYLDEEDDDTMI